MAANRFPVVFPPRRKYFLLPQPSVLPFKALPFPFEFAGNRRFESNFPFHKVPRAALVPFKFMARFVLGSAAKCFGINFILLRPRVLVACGVSFVGSCSLVAFKHFGKCPPVAAVSWAVLPCAGIP